MQYPAWKQRALAALERQEQIEQNSGYDVRESLIAVRTMQQWVIENSCEDQAEFLTQLTAYYQSVRQNWPFPGEYSGGTASLGGCYAAIERAVLNPNSEPDRAVRPYHRMQRQETVVAASPSPIRRWFEHRTVRPYHRMQRQETPMAASPSPIRRWFEQCYPHWFMGWRECLKVELKSFALGLLISTVIFLLIYLGFYKKW